MNANTNNKSPSRTVKCLRCNYKWEPITKNPKACPSCKSYRWNSSPTGIKHTVGSSSSGIIIDCYNDFIEVTDDHNFRVSYTPDELVKALGLTK